VATREALSALFGHLSKGRDPLNTYKKIALLTPYNGNNLGDAAIQDAVIVNIRKRYPDAEICLITLWPEATTKLHGVLSFPITCLPHGNDADAPTTVTHGLLSRVKAATKRSSLLYSALKRVYKQLAIAGRLPWLFCKEIVHIARAYKFMKDISLLVISGGGQLDDYWGGPWQHPYALFKWGLIARAVGARYVFLSVGTCSLASRLSHFFIYHALRLATYRSYRDQTSKRLLEHMDFTRNDAVYPDLAFSYVNHSTGSRNVGRVVGVSPIAYLSQHGWPKVDLSVYVRYFGNLVHFISDLLRQGYSVVLFSTDLQDSKVVNDVVDSLAKDVSLNIDGRIWQPRTDTLDELFAQLLKADYVVASRLHGVLLSHLLYIPVLAVSYDRKVDTHMRDMGLSEYCLDIHNLETMSLLKAFELLTMNAGLIRSELKNRHIEYAHALERQYDFVLGT